MEEPTNYEKDSDVVNERIISISFLVVYSLTLFALIITAVKTFLIK
jgi:hypothetical protein